MTPTPAETALWRALNVEPEEGKPVGGYVEWGTPYHVWLRDKLAFAASHPADRLAYFEGPLFERGCSLTLERDPQALPHTDAMWFLANGLSLASAVDNDELNARFHAAARAIHALGMITDAQMKEIEDVDS